MRVTVSTGLRACAALALCAFALPSHAQTITVAPRTARIVQVQGGPGGWANLRITSPGDPETATPQNWTATVTYPTPTEPWLRLSAAAGATPATLSLGIIDWRSTGMATGKYQATVNVKSGAANFVIPVEFEVRPENPPTPFTYLAGPNGCIASKGYPDPPLCTPLALPGLAGSLAPPAGASYIDPNFGARVRVVAGGDIHHEYATPNPLSAHNKYMMVYTHDGTHDVIDATTGKTLFRSVPGNQTPVWDAAVDELYYYIHNAAIMKRDLRNNKSSVVIDYATQPEHFQYLLRGGTGDTSKDNWMTFWAPEEKEVCALDLNHLRTYCADYAATQRKLPFGTIDFTLITKGVDKTSGKRYVMLVAPPAMGVFSVDLERGVLKPEFRGPEDPERGLNHNGVCDPGERCMVGSHMDTLEDSAGVQYLVEDVETIGPCEVALNTFQLNKGIDMVKQVELGGGRRKIMTLWRCGPGWVDEHIGCAKSAPYCVISTQSPLRARDATAPATPTPHANEIIVMRENGLELRRLALTRAVYYHGSGDGNYWVAPRAAISNDGSLVVSDTNFGQLGAPGITVVETGFPAKPNK